MRYEYNLTPESVVIDAGAHIGNWANIICEKYGCRLFAFEPIHEFAMQAAEKLARFPKAQVFTIGLGGSTRAETFHVKGDMSGKYADGCVSTHVNIRDIAEVLEEFGLAAVDCLKINTEGCEFEILERILDAGLAPRFRNLQVQFHPVVPDYTARHDRIRERLAATHELQYDAPWIWSGWRITA